MLKVQESFDASGLPAFASEVVQHVEHDLNERVREAARYGKGGRDNFGIPNYIWARSWLHLDKLASKRERELTVAIYSAFAGIVPLFDETDMDEPSGTDYCPHCRLNVLDTGECPKCEYIPSLGTYAINFACDVPRLD